MTAFKTSSTDTTETTEIKSSTIANCTIAVSKADSLSGKALFCENKKDDGSCFVNLDGYATIPVKQYEDLRLICEHDKPLIEVARAVAMRNK